MYHVNFSYLLSPHKSIYKNLIRVRLLIEYLNVVHYRDVRDLKEVPMTLNPLSAMLHIKYLSLVCLCLSTALLLLSDTN